jgi:hypothetical protein
MIEKQKGEAEEILKIIVASLNTARNNLSNKSSINHSG